MMKPRNTRLYAGAAIAAALALNSTPLLAQMAPAPTSPVTTTVTPEPVLVIPTAPTTPPAQPTIVLPTELPEAAPPPAAAVPNEPAAARTTTTPTATTRAAAPAATPAAERTAPRATAAPARVAAEPTTAVIEEPVEPVAVEIAPEPVAEIAPVAETPREPAVASDTSEGTSFWLALLGALAAVGLAIWGFVAIGRRKPIDRKAATIVERPVAPRPAIAPPVMVEPGPVAPEAVAPSVSPLRTATPAPSLAHSGAAVPLPRTMPATFEERDALIRRMIEAKPDRANPFTAPLQRRKRAKLILQSLGRDFSDREPWIDLSQYPANWPELARRNTAAA